MQAFVVHDQHMIIWSPSSLLSLHPTKIIFKGSIVIDEEDKCLWNQHFINVLCWLFFAHIFGRNFWGPKCPINDTVELLSSYKMESVNPSWLGDLTMCEEWCVQGLGNILRVQISAFRRNLPIPLGIQLHGDNDESLRCIYEMSPTQDFSDVLNLEISSCWDRNSWF